MNLWFNYYLYRDEEDTGNMEWTVYEDDLGTGELVHSRAGGTDGFMIDDYVYFLIKVAKAIGRKVNMNVIDELT